MLEKRSKRMSDTLDEKNIIEVYVFKYHDKFEQIVNEMVREIMNDKNANRTDKANILMSFAASTFTNIVLNILLNDIPISRHNEFIEEFTRDVFERLKHHTSEVINEISQEDKKNVMYN